MLTIKTIMSQIQGGDWFVTIDLKDAYFRIQVIQLHRRFLRFAFGGKAYQYKVLPFSLAMDAALAPLRLQGIGVPELPLLGSCTLPSGASLSHGV